MFTLFVSLLFSVPACFRTWAALQAEILALRHQLLVLQRSSRGHKLRLSSADRVLWVWLSRLWTEWRSALIIVKPETVIGWHRRGFRLYWRWKSRHPAGRPSGRVKLGISSGERVWPTRIGVLRAFMGN